MDDLRLLADAPIMVAPRPSDDADPHDRLITAAVLAATAFRMKDMEGLLYALRALADAVDSVDDRREAA